MDLCLLSSFEDFLFIRTTLVHASGRESEMEVSGVSLRNVFRSQRQRDKTIEKKILFWSRSSVRRYF